MDNSFLSGGIAELQDAKAAIVDSNERQTAYNAASADVASKEKDLEGQKNTLLIKQTTQSKTGELS